LIIGVPKEVKNLEFRVSLTPAGVRELVARKHQVLVEKFAGVGSGISDEEYVSAGAKIIDDAAGVWSAADLIIKVKEPIASEYGLLRRDQILFTYLHLAASTDCTKALLDSGITAIAYETVGKDGVAPLLAPMSEVAGRMSIQVGAHHLEAAQGGRGVLMGGVPGVTAAQVVIIGAGVSGTQAAVVAHGMGARVSILDKNINRLRELDHRFSGTVQTIYSTDLALEEAVTHADLVIGAVLIPGKKAPKLISNSLVAKMKPGSVLVDIAIDQGGCFEDSHPTTHAEPTFKVHNSIFYCVANMPGAFPRTSTFALTNATLPFLLNLADLGWKQACMNDPALLAGLSTHGGKLFSEQVGASLDLPFTNVTNATDFDDLFK
jgi:alanine dehydrogenase